MQWSERDEAARLLRNAHGKLAKEDLYGARKCAVKAHCIYPLTDGLPQLLAVLHVLILEKEKLHGVELNWHAVLQVDPAADDATIRKQYKKLALLLHPDKNKTVGADAAFKLVSEAWEVLSGKRMKRGFDKNASRSRTDGKRSTATSDAYRSFRASYQSRKPQRPPTSTASYSWTECPVCKMPCECWCRLRCDCLRRHNSQPVRCPKCRKPFLVKDCRFRLCVVVILIAVKLLL
eukprot:c19542_g1_i1 orf=360-1061(-)